MRAKPKPVLNSTALNPKDGANKPMPATSLLRLGTRGSKLALAQAELAVRALQTATGEACEIVPIKTSGDRIKDKPLADAGGKALFVKELEDALLEGIIDFAVHSMKDVPVELPEGLGIAAILPRENPFDALVLPMGRLERDLPERPRIGTCSVRRAAQARRAWPGAQILPLRGNVDTRLAKLDGGAFDAIPLAYAGLRRLGLEARANRILSSKNWLPALAQGAIGIETREGDERTNARLEILGDASAMLTVSCERAFQLGLGGSCRSPIAGIAEIAGNRLQFHGEVIAPDGTAFVETAFEMTVEKDFSEAVSRIRRKGLEAGEMLRPRASNWLDL